MEMIFRGVDALVTNGFEYLIGVWRSMGTCQQSASSVGDPCNMVLQLTPNWPWQRFLERFETRRRGARQLDRFINGWSLLVLRLCVFSRASHSDS